MNRMTELSYDTIEIEIDNSRFDIDAIYRSGQAFTIKKEDNRFIVVSKDKVCVIIKNDDSSFIYVKKEDYMYWIIYFNFAIPFFYYLEQMEEKGNDFIKKCAKYSDGLVILKQDLWETMMSFIISQRKSIPSIYTSINRLKQYFGTPHEVLFDKIGKISFIELPTPDKFIWGKDIASTIEIFKEGKTSDAKNLKECGLGYRDEYILYAAAYLNSLGRASIDKLYNKSYDEHMKDLLKIRGIGEKVANCICLFAFNDLDSFPVDVWIKRILEKDLLPKDLSNFDGYKGFLQQIIFYYIINHKDEIKL